MNIRTRHFRVIGTAKLMPLALPGNFYSKMYETFEVVHALKKPKIFKVSAPAMWQVEQGMCQID